MRLLDMGFDFLSADALLRLISVRGGNLVTPSGMRYRGVQLGGSSRRMTLPVLRKLDELVRGGCDRDRQEAGVVPESRGRSG